MKGQSLIIQFILFFIIGLSIFIAIGNLFTFQSNLLGADIANETRKNIANYIASIIINQNSCKACDRISQTIILRNKTVGEYVQLILEDEGLFVVMLPSGKYYGMSLKNLEKSFRTEGFGYSNKPLKIIFSKIENKIEVVQ